VARPREKAIVFLAWKLLNNTVLYFPSLACNTMSWLHADWYNLSKEQVDAARLDLTTILQTLQGNHSRATERIQSELE
jgi:hypothetical protein